MIGVHKVVWVHEKIHFECACGFRRWSRSSFVFETPSRSDHVVMSAQRRAMSVQTRIAVGAEVLSTLRLYDSTLRHK